MYLIQKNGNPGSRILNIMTNATERLPKKEFALFQVHPQDMDRLFQACIMMPSYVNIGAMLMLVLTHGQQ
jgi:hypothetical protein